MNPISNEIINAYQAKCSNISERILIKWLERFSSKELGFLKRVQKNGEVKYSLRKIEFYANKKRSEGRI